MVLNELLLRIDAEWRDDYVRFVETGEASDEFLSYLDSHEDCERLITFVFADPDAYEPRDSREAQDPHEHADPHEALDRHETLDRREAPPSPPRSLQQSASASQAASAAPMLVRSRKRS